MVKIKVGKKNYTLRFGYKAVAKSRITQKVMEIQKLMEKEEVGELVGEMFEVLADLVLAGLQKTEEEFSCDYEDADDVKEKTEKVFDLLDDYLASDDAMSGTELFAELSNELFECGFFERKTPKQKAVLESVDATVIPMEHKNKEN